MNIISAFNNLKEFNIGDKVKIAAICSDFGNGYKIGDVYTIINIVRHDVPNFNCRHKTHGSACYIANNNCCITALNNKSMRPVFNCCFVLEKIREQGD